MGRLKNKDVTRPYQVLRVCRVSKSLGLRGKVGCLSFLGKGRERELGAVDEKLPCLRKSSVERTGAFQYESGYSKSSSADQYSNILREDEDELEAVDGVLGV